MESRIRNSTVKQGNRSVLGALREAQIVQSRPVLPAEILSSILDFLDVKDLARCARASKRLREMVYDDTRWVRRLKLMGAWSESAARVKNDAHLLMQQSATMKSPSGFLSKQMGQLSKEAPLVTINPPTSANKRESEDCESLNFSRDGFREVVTLSSLPATESLPDVKRKASSETDLEILTKVRSERGAARGEYAKVHLVLNPLYQDATRIDEPSHAKIFKIYRDPGHQAKMVSQLCRFSEADIALGWQDRKNCITAVHDAFEHAIFAEFDEALLAENQDERMMKYAHVLYCLDGGQRAINAFINSNSVIASPYKIGDASDCIIQGESPEFQPDEYLRFLQRLATQTANECGRIDYIFPAAANVMEPFIERMAEVVLRPFLDKLFCTMREAGVEQLVRTVSSTFAQNSGFVENVCQNPRLRQSLTLGHEIRTIYDLIIPEYLDDELGWFKEQSEAEVLRWEQQLFEQNASIEAMYMASVTRQAEKRDFLSSFKKVVMAPVNILPAFSFGLKPTNSTDDSVSPPRSASRSSGVSIGLHSHRKSSRELGRSGSALPLTSKDGELPTNELDAKAAIMQSRLEGIKTLFSLELALSLVHLAKASIERVAVFAKNDNKYQENARTRCESIFVDMLQILGQRHIRSGFTQALEHLSDYNPRTTQIRAESQMVAPLVTFLELVNVGDLIQQMIDVFYEQELVNAGLTDKNDFLNETVKSKKRFEQMLDEKVAAGLNSGIEVLMSEVEYICATTQELEDYNPEAAGTPGNRVNDISTTETARRVVRLVETHSSMLLGTTDKTMLDVFNQEIGLRLFGVLCKHIKRQRISIAGAPRIMSDMNHYFSFVQTLKNRDLQQYFRALCELSPIYLIDGRNAKELAVVIADHDRYSGIFGAEEVLEFAERRADWYLIKTKVEKAMYGIGCGVM